MRILKLAKTSVSGSPNGLTTGTTGNGTRVDDDRISLGTGDVFKIKAIYESEDSNDPIIPNFQYTNLLGTISVDEILTGDSSGSRARVVSTTSNYVYYIPVEDDVFTDGETITGPNSTLKIVLGSNNRGSTNITDNFTLDDGQLSLIHI